ncbi:MAG TPA: ABC transporter permease [Fimbriimonas sp.]|nr:ABC transporter permease [Fimbriimonas sp.]
MNAIWTIASKDLKILIRDKAGLFWVLGFPLLIAILFGTIFAGSGEGGASKMKIAVIDLDNSTASRAFVDKLKESAALDIQKQSVDPQGLVRKGDLVAAVTVPKGFGANSIFSGRQPEIEVMIDPSRKADAGYLQGILAEASFAPMQESFSNPAVAKVELTRSQEQVQADASMSPEQKASLLQFLGAADKYFANNEQSQTTAPAFAGPKIKQVPVTREEIGPRSSYDITFPQGIVWGLVGVATAFCISMVRERVGGTFMRLKVSPLTSGQLLLGKSLACFVAAIGVMGLLLVFGILVFRIRIDSFPMLGLAVLSSSIGIVGVMMLLSVIGKTEEAVSGAGRAALLMMSMIGGGMIPVMMMPPWMQAISNFSPVKWVVLSLEGAIWRGFSFSEMMLPCGILLAIGLGAFAAGATVLSKTKD